MTVDFYYLADEQGNLISGEKRSLDDAVRALPQSGPLQKLCENFWRCGRYFIMRATIGVTSIIRA